MQGYGVYFLFIIPPFVLGLVVQHWLKTTVTRELQVPVANGLTGAQAAREILDRNGLHAVAIERANGGPLSDNYDPGKRKLFLSQPVYDGVSVASTAIAAHESGHAIQHSKAYKPMEIRSALFPVVAFASNTWMLLLLVGFVTQALGIIQFAIALFAAIVLFQLVTLPVEFDASRRALGQITDLGLVTSAEHQGASKVLKAAAMTYVAGALAAVAQLAYYLLIFFGGSRR
jgi:Zn-dependent membrane protease YugP